ncbi:hypothetical protein CLIB1423_18S03180 [[Candida] railenensis]|uniref:PI31 proteasome regulator C-terminal domain-containing protein n=1 Tax=[Candida] railenensis TaxID=45579 RepID=A0A9P0W093_9ASCO|nr:hypothetical protein CLIB1423_18S03180 [[Candida] railenensis]
MAFDNVLQIATSVIRDWISDVTNDAKHTIYETPTFTQFLYVKDKQTVVTLNLVLQREKEITILFIYTLDNKSQSYPVNFTDDLSITLPIDTITDELREQLIKQFSGEEENLKNALKTRNLQESETQLPQQERKIPQELRVQNAKLPKLDFEVTRSPQGQQRSRPADMPDFDDEYEVLPKNNAGRRDNRDIFPSIGDDDLNPPGLPKNPELRPYLDHGRGSASGGGMYPSLDHPLFRGGGEGRDSNANIPGLPSGARYDDPMAGGGPGGLGFDGAAGPNFDGSFGPNSSRRGRGGGAPGFPPPPGSGSSGGGFGNFGSFGGF